MKINGRMSIRTEARELTMWGANGQGRSSCNVLISFGNGRNRQRLLGNIVGMVAAEVMNIVQDPATPQTWNYLRCRFYRSVPFSEHRILWIHERKMIVVDTSQHHNANITAHAKVYGELVDCEDVWPETPLVVPIGHMKETYTRVNNGIGRLPPMSDSWAVVVEFNNRKYCGI